MLRALSSPGPRQADGGRGPQSKFSLFLQYPLPTPPPTPLPLPLPPPPTLQLRAGPGILPSGAFLPLVACLWEGRMGGPSGHLCPAGKSPGQDPRGKGKGSRQGLGWAASLEGQKARVHDDPARAGRPVAFPTSRGRRRALVGGEEGRASALALKHSVR